MKPLQPKLCVYANSAIMVALSLYFFLIPAVMLLVDLNDPGLSSGQTPRFAFRWHRSLSPKYERWARERVAAGPASGLSGLGVSGTEWPVFGSVFYLWATEALQRAVEEDPSLSPREPKDYARASPGARRSLSRFVPTLIAPVSSYCPSSIKVRLDIAGLFASREAAGRTQQFRADQL